MLTPYTLSAGGIQTHTQYKDACNAKSNQQNLGTIRSSNLCTEIVQYTSQEEVAVCNLASVVLPKFVRTDEQGRPAFDHQRLFEVTQVVVRNLNKIIDCNLYPVPEARNSNFRHRPIGACVLAPTGPATSKQQNVNHCRTSPLTKHHNTSAGLGVQGLADTFIQLRLPFDSEAARRVNREIFETIYFAAVTASVELAKRDGPYQTFPGSPASQGKLQFDLWGVTPESGRWDWEALKGEVAQHGMRNSLLLAPMPTASTAQILGACVCICIRHGWGGCSEEGRGRAPRLDSSN